MEASLQLRRSLYTICDHIWPSVVHHHMLSMKGSLLLLAFFILHGHLYNYVFECFHFFNGVLCASPRFAELFGDVFV